MGGVNDRMMNKFQLYETKHEQCTEIASERLSSKVKRKVRESPR